MNSINKTYIRPFVLTLTILGLVIASCTQDDHINGTQEHSEEVEYHPLHTGDRELLELRSALHGRQEELVAGYQKGINYKAISWERARIKKEAGRDIIFVPFKTNKSEGTLTYLNYIRSFKNQKNRNVPPIQLFIYKFDVARNLNIYSLSGRMVAVKKVGENVQDITRHLLKGGDEDFWHLGGELEEVVITAPGGGGDTPPPVWDPCADGLCGGDIAPPTTNPHPDYPDCYYSGGCGGNTDNGNSDVESESNYPGKDKGLPYQWWKDTDFIINSGYFDIDDEQPNAKEAALFAIFRSQAILHIENSVTALNKAFELTQDGTFDPNGIEDGKADAFRHAFWNALGTAEFGSDIMKLFADAHEWGETGLAVDMDFHNNHEGRIIGDNFGFSSSDNDISNAIMDAVNDGQLKYINNGNLVPTNQ